MPREGHTAMSLSNEMIEIIDRIKKEELCNSRSEVLRMMLRHYIQTKKPLKRVPSSKSTMAV